MAEDGIGSESPLRNPHYFLGPLRTLRKSLSLQKDISIQDVANAYAILCSRIRECGEMLYSISPVSLSNYQALETLKQFKQPLLVAINQHIQVSNTATVDHTEDMVILRHAAMLFVSDLFKFRSLYFILSDNDMSDLLQSIMIVEDLSRARRKSALCTLWILSTQELPGRVLSRCKDDIVKFLKRAITEANEMAIQALQTTQYLLGNSSSGFLRSFVDNLLSEVLQHLMSQNKRLFALSSEVTASFAHALLNEDPPVLDVKEKASAIVGRFIDKNNSRRSATRLESFLAFCYTDGAGQLQPTTLSDSVRYIRMTASLITITGPQIFARPSSLKLLLNTLKRAKDIFKEHGLLHGRIRQKDDEGNSRNFAALRRLLDAAWRSVVWTYSQLSPMTICPASRAGGRSKRQMDYKDVRESAFKIVEQEFGVEMGILLAAHFLNTSPDDSTSQRDITKVLRILSKLLARSSWATVGVSLFRRLVATLLDGSKQAAKSWDDKNIVVPELFNGILFDSEQPKELCSSISSFDMSAPFDVVPPLTEAEIAGSRWEEMVTMWSEAVHDRLRDGDRSMSVDIVEIWQALLLARAQLTQGNGHLCVEPERADFLSSVLTSFVLASQEIRPDVEHIQSLLVVLQLWRVVRNVFGMASSEKMAKDILTCILMQTFSLEDEAVNEAWSVLCIELIEDGTPRALNADPDIPSTGQLIESKKVVWKLATERSLERIISSETGTDLAALLGHSKDLLCVPIGQWELTEDTLWDSLLRSSLTVGDFEKSACTLLDGVSVAAKEAMDAGKHTIGVLHGLLLFLDELYTTSGVQGYPATLLSIVRDILADSYPPTASTVNDCQMLLALLSNLLGRGCATRRLALLTSVKDALIPWFADRHMILAEDRYTDMLKLMYTEAINTILSNGPTQALVIGFADFLAAPFLRPDIPRPAVGPMSFKSFWETVEQHIKLDDENCPDSIKLCLYRMQEFGHPLPSWLQEELLQSPASALRSPVSDIIPSSVVDVPLSPSVPLSVLALRASPITRRSSFTNVNEWFNGLSPSPIRAANVDAPISPAPMTLKRTSMLASRPLKRRKVESKAEAPSSRIDPPSRRSQTASRADREASQIHPLSVSPVPKVTARKNRVLLDVIEVEPLRSSLKRKYKTLSPDEYTGSAYASPRIKSEDDSVLDEYSMWETGLSSQDVTDALDMTSEGQKSGVMSACLNETPDTSVEDGDTSSFLSGDGIVTSDSLSVSHDLLKRVKDRSQTVPPALPSYSPSMPLGSKHTLHPTSGSQASPHIRRSATSPLPLDLLLCIQKYVTADGADEMQTQVLAQSAEVVHDIAGKLRTAMAKKLTVDRQPSRAPSSS